MRKAYHIDQRVQCADCPVFYCIECQPNGCVCGSKEYIYDHNGHEYNERGRVEIDNLPPQEGQILYRDSFISSLPPFWGRGLGPVIQPGQTITTSDGYSQWVGSTGESEVASNTLNSLGQGLAQEGDTVSGALTGSNLRSAVDMVRNQTTSSGAGQVDREVLNRAYNMILDQN